MPVQNWCLSNKLAAHERTSRRKIQLLLMSWRAAGDKLPRKGWRNLPATSSLHRWGKRVHKNRAGTKQKQIWHPRPNINIPGKHPDRTWIILLKFSAMFYEKNDYVHLHAKHATCIGGVFERVGKRPRSDTHPSNYSIFLLLIWEQQDYNVVKAEDNGQTPSCYLVFRSLHMLCVVCRCTLWQWWLEEYVACISTV